MMVLLVSQCEKKALKRTRRVLDAFADRIGDNTWQTVITEEGLSAVKKLLRKTASKSTAVSCHWIRSRARSELLWIVGRRAAFNHFGLVPVNYTSKEVIMDKLPTDTDRLLANTRSQKLSMHLFAVGFVAYQILKKLQIDNPRLLQAAFIAGILHDIGKIDPEFQKWVTKKVGKLLAEFLPDDGVHIDSPAKFSFEKHPRHHEISWIIAEALLSGSELNSAQRGQIAHAIYWHHTRPFRKVDNFTKPEAVYGVFIKALENRQFQEVYCEVLTVLKDISWLAEKFDLQQLMPEFSELFSLTPNPFPEYKKYDSWSDQIPELQANVRENALNNLVRSAVISADRIVSSCSREDLEEYLAEVSLEELVDRELDHDDSSLQLEIERCLKGFNMSYPNSLRNEKQSETALALGDLKRIAAINNSPNVSVLQGPAGCGKTKIALEWAMLTGAKKVIWVCPRVQVCLGLLHDLIDDEYLPRSRIEILTGEYKKILGNGKTFDDTPDTEETDYFSGDIVITTIDQVVNSIITHHRVTTLIDMLNVHVVFDEFHELVNMTAFNLLFAELIEAKKQLGSAANTLLISATPHYLYLTNFLSIPQEDLVAIDSFNSAEYAIEFSIYDEEESISPLIDSPQPAGTFVITNTAQDAQLGYLYHHGTENNVLLHSKYTKQDKAYWFNEVFSCFRRNGTRKFDVLRSGPIVQASLNITSSRMLTEFTSAENWLQRLGRLDRFGENQTINVYITVMPKSIDESGKQTSSCARFLNQLCILESAKAWIEFLKDKLGGKEHVTINQLYEIYRAFYADSNVKKVITQDLLLALKKSVTLINEKVIDPISVPPKSKQSQSVVKISANSLRGDNRFVQMAVCEVSEDLQLRFTEEYAYSENFDSSQIQAAITESIDAMRGYGDDDANLVQFMQKKHHNIKQHEGFKKARNEWELIKEARSPERPIYLSYTPEDLQVVNRKPHPQAVYYVVSNKQPVGAISLAKLKIKLKNKVTE